MVNKIIGIRSGNAIIPYSGATRRTKQVDLTFNTTPTGWASQHAVGLAYADSDDNWRLIFNFHGTISPADDIFTVRIDGVTFPAVNQAISASDDAFGYAASNPYVNDNNIQISFLTATTSFHVSGDVALASKPAWAAANMEGVVNAPVYIDFGGTGMPGEYKIGTGTHSDTSFSGTDVVSDVDSVALTPGRWLINARCTFVGSGSTSTAFRGGIGSTSGNNLTGIAAGDSHRWDFEDSIGSKVFSTSATRVVTITTNTTYYCKAVASYSGGTPKYTGEILATRLAP